MSIANQSVTVAVTQMPCDWDVEANLRRAEALVRRAAAAGANVILLQELFETPYFCPDQKQALFALARPLEAWNPRPLIDGNDLIAHGLEPGRHFSEILDQVRDAQLDGEIGSKEEALQRVDRMRYP